ncbi:hypothetical protein EV644_101544 [Kribbella orskensis]|uniref:Uncharacterized protein n=1 Tax=Kribbella orskensis TaxID=2512216 RepID=A0ABY2BVA0_9ACTN|nr:MULTISPECIES: hypothetical protein [Kribbella]TCN44321.1 hypothetical protein EV642_101445 [Kribbella sp. VKM Ac-2500]TCO31901.1 hypothetical protein EV644_101544 [Kribbella orskensis]
MRLEALFEDLESQFEAMQDGDLYGEVADRIRAEVGKITVLDRLRGAVGTVVRVELTLADPVQGKLSRVGKDCLLLEAERYEEWLIPDTALTAVHQLGPWAEPAEGAVAAKLGLAHLLRGIARDRSPVTLFCGGTPVTGTIDRVGADFLELAEHPLDAPRRRTEVYNTRLVPTRALDAVRRR